MIRNEPSDDFGLAPAAFAVEGLPVLEVDAWDGAAPWPKPQEVSGMAVFGGAMNCDQVERFPFLATERALLARAVVEDLPVLGVCLGAQLLVRAFDCPVFPAPVRELGFPVITLTEHAEADPLLGHLPASARSPPGSTVLATGQGGAIQAFRAGSAWGVQFHPEVTADELDRWFDEAGNSITSRWGRDESDLRREVADELPAANHLGREIFRRFARLVRERSARD
jgi:GMP synthase (glutamine-hydrolysing)